MKSFLSKRVNTLGFVYFFLGFLGLGVGVVHAESYSRSCEYLNTVWKSSYHRLFKVQNDLLEFECPSLTSSVADALNHLWLPVFKTGANAVDPRFFSQLAGEIKEMILIEPGGAVPLPPEYDNIIATESQRVVRIYPGFKTESADYRAASLVHEGRHTHDEDPSHVTCDHGPAKGDKASCDEVFYEGQLHKGSGYNYTFLYMMWVRDHSEYAELDRAVLDTSIKSLIGSRFNRITNEQVKKWGWYYPDPVAAVDVREVF